jgi:Ca2+-binding RTX toxin-like protein
VLSNLVTDVEVAEIAGADGGATDAPLSIDASAVGAAMSLKGNDGNNGLAGTSFDDTLTGGLGADVIEGRGGADRFVYQAAADSTGPGYDTVKGADFAAADTWDLPGVVNAIDATIAGGRLTTANFDSQLEAAADAAHLTKRHAVLFTPDEGNLAGKTFLVVDMNGTAGYQGGEDLVVLLNAPKHLGALDAADFV